MKLNELLAFVTVVETGNITLAAERLNRVQSSISHRIRSLESSLDATLLDRKNEGASQPSRERYCMNMPSKCLTWRMIANTTLPFQKDAD